MELPRLEELYRKYKDRGLVVLAINFEPQVEGTPKFIEEHGLTFPFLVDEPGEGNLTRNTFGARPFPYTYITDAEGRILYLHGTWNEGDERIVEQHILSILEE